MADPITIPIKLTLTSGPDAYTVPDEVQWIKFKPDYAVNVHTESTAGTSVYPLAANEVYEIRNADIGNQIIYFSGTSGKFVYITYATGRSSY